MLFYYGRRYESSAVGSRLVRVHCDKCGCEYFFELARVGLGLAGAVCDWDSPAARRADERARRDLAERLENDAELVPCPKCDWINEELVFAIPSGSLSRLDQLRGVRRLPRNRHLADLCVVRFHWARDGSWRRALLADSGSDDLGCPRCARPPLPVLAQEENPAKSGLSGPSKTANRRASSITSGSGERTGRPYGPAEDAWLRDWRMD